MKIFDLNVEIVYKNIKNLHLKIEPATGIIKISAPHRLSLQIIVNFIQSKLDWIRQHQPKPGKDYIDNEPHLFSGQIYTLKLIEHEYDIKIFNTDSEIILQTPPQTTAVERQYYLEFWYQRQLYLKTDRLMSKWQEKMGVKIQKFSIRKMKTRWGSCTTNTQSIRINLELAKKSDDCLEYVVVHELAHLLEPSHNHRFKSIMDTHLPLWRELKAKLNE